MVCQICCKLLGSWLEAAEPGSWSRLVQPPVRGGQADNDHTLGGVVNVNLSIGRTPLCVGPINGRARDGGAPFFRLMFVVLPDPPAGRPVPQRGQRYLRRRVERAGTRARPGSAWTVAAWAAVLLVAVRGGGATVEGCALLESTAYPAAELPMRRRRSHTAGCRASPLPPLASSPAPVVSAATRTHPHEPTAVHNGR